MSILNLLIICTYPIPTDRDGSIPPRCYSRQVSLSHLYVFHRQFSPLACVSSRQTQFLGQSPSLRTMERADGNVKTKGRKAIVST